MTEMTPAILPSANALNYCWTQYSNNNTGCWHHQHKAEEMAIYIINQFICLFGLLGNGIVLWLLRLHLRKNYFIIYIFNLAVADSSFLLCCMFVTIVFTVEYFGSCHFPWCTQMYTLYRMELFFCSTGIYFLTAISTERYLCVLFPFWYHYQRSKWLSGAISGVLWSFAIVLSGINISSCSLSLQPSVLCQYTTRIIVITNLFIFTPIMILSSLFLFIKVRYCLQQCQQGVYKTVLLTVLFFVTFATPLSVQHLLSEFTDYKSPKVAYLLASVNSSINPAIYFLVGSRREKWFKDSLHFILQRALNEEKNSTETGRVSSLEIKNNRHGLPHAATTCQGLVSNSSSKFNCCHQVDFKAYSG
ncbi:mas-related G-protein coupled receptor member H-like [Hemicordylus capensis]|uniref:mas-related G-protein coupled receptor member H-like n=1 Tax=Hemicordylus capensis TaxID=884348 RepID=UPI0023033186|nr:mas-related G-protein coupled receptor member H-like [Hemicordylus capensis]